MNEKQVLIRRIFKVRKPNKEVVHKVFDKYWSEFKEEQRSSINLFDFQDKVNEECHTRQLVGYTVAFVKHNKIYIGYALWDGQPWNGAKFSKPLGRTLAIERAVSLDMLNPQDVPARAEQSVRTMIGEAINYFRQVPFPSNP